MSLCTFSVDLGIDYCGWGFEGGDGPMRWHKARILLSLLCGNLICCPSCHSLAPVCMESPNLAAGRGIASPWRQHDRKWDAQAGESEWNGRDIAVDWENIGVLVRNSDGLTITFPHSMS
jgi:hypothetical protein